MKKLSNKGRLFEVESMSCSLNHHDVRVFDSRQAIVVILLIVNNFSLERARPIEQQSWSFEGAACFIAIDFGLVLEDCSQVAGERAVFVQVK